MRTKVTEHPKKGYVVVRTYPFFGHPKVYVARYGGSWVDSKGDGVLVCRSYWLNDVVKEHCIAKGTRLSDKDKVLEGINPKHLEL